MRNGRSLHLPWLAFCLATSETRASAQLTEMGMSTETCNRAFWVDGGIERSGNHGGLPETTSSVCTNQGFEAAYNSAYLKLGALRGFHGRVVVSKRSNCSSPYSFCERSSCKEREAQLGTPDVYPEAANGSPIEGATITLIPASHHWSNPASNLPRLIKTDATNSRE